MPWSLSQRDGEWCVTKDSDGSVAGCHGSRADAIKQQRALYAQEARVASMYAELDAAPDPEPVPVVVEEQKSELMGGAAVTIVATTYLEPFGGVAVESMMCGTPVVTTDFGAFVETVLEGVSGYRFQTLQEAVDATSDAMQLDRELVREYAERRYSLEAVAPRYNRWFDNLDGLWGEGWTKLRPRELVA